MSPEQFYRAVLDLNKERDVPRLLDTALAIAKRATGAAAAQIELGPVRRSDGASWTCAHVAPDVCISGASCTVCLHPPATGMRVERPSITLLTQQVSLVFDILARNEPCLGLRVELRELRDVRVQQALERNHGNIAAAARQLKVARSYVYDVVAALRQRRLER